MIHSCYNYSIKIKINTQQDFRNNLNPLWHQLCTYLKRQKNIKKGAGRKKASGRKNERHEEVQEDSDMTLSPLCRSSAARYAGNSAAACGAAPSRQCTALQILQYQRAPLRQRIARRASQLSPADSSNSAPLKSPRSLPLKLLKLVYLQVVKAARDETLRSSQTASEDRPHWCFSSLLPALQKLLLLDTFFSSLTFFFLSLVQKKAENFRH